ncbi:MAG TPA: AAA family ATPase [Paludibacter sp.]|nr:AAA family ATPase [Paludibacter sp.]
MSKKYWLYAPGENAYKWDEFYELGIMALGWDELEDLRQYDNQEEIREALIAAYGGDGSKKNDVSANYDFLNTVNIGDIIIVKKGRGELLGFGEVTSDYIYDKNRSDYNSIRKVDWKLKGNWKINFILVIKTLTDITTYPSDDNQYNKYYEQLLGIMTTENSMNKNVAYYVLGAHWDGSDETERFIENGIWENGYTDKFLDVVNGINIGDRVAIKSSFATKDGRSFLRIKAFGTVTGNEKNGRVLKIKYDDRFPEFDLEGYGGYRNTIQKVADEHIDVIFNYPINMNYKEQYTAWLKNREENHKASSYVRAIDILTQITKKEIFEENSLLKLQELYDELLREQRNQKSGGKYFYPKAISYGEKGFYSAAIKSYSDFIEQLNIPNAQATILAKTTITTSSITPSLPLNQILFGPPGTGKTYNTIDKAVYITSPERYSKEQGHGQNKIVFDELREQGRIEFVTFHQNYSYEDFMVGIRPNVSETTNELSFKNHYGIFYKIAKRARENYENSLKDEQTISKENWVKKKFEEFKDYVESEIEENGKFTIKNNVSVYSVEDEVFIYTGEKEPGEFWKNQRIGMHYDALINIYLADAQSRQDIKKLENVPGLEKQHATYSLEVIKKFREFLRVKGYQYRSSTTQKEPLKNFVLIIDEINRANISKVFGELITLLEDDKRLGEDNELKITLPNGEKDFGVPPNLYIIGTMNTADKSIALIDIALRRRFELIAFYPDYGLLKSEASELLQKINEEIYELKNSADFLIGHAYFMKDEPIETTLKNRVIPLLMEYFSGKTDIVSTIFNETDWKVEYDTRIFNWIISRR